MEECVPDWYKNIIFLPRVRVPQWNCPLILIPLLFWDKAKQNMGTGTQPTSNLCHNLQVCFLSNKHLVIQSIEIRRILRFHYLKLPMAPLGHQFNQKET